VNTGDKTLDVQVRSIDSVVVVTATGEVDMASAPRLQRSIEDAVQGQSGVLIVDLSGVGFFGSAGLSVLVLASESEQVEELRVVASRVVRRPIEVTGLDQAVAVYDTLHSALAAEQAS